MFKSILHPNSLRASDDKAFDHALALAVKFRSDLSILHVDEDKKEEHEWDRFPAVRQRLFEWNLLDEDASQADVEKLLGIGIKKIDAKYVNPVAATLGFLEKESAELVVMSNGGRKGMKQWLSPSVSEPIARKANIPCLFIPDAARGLVAPDSGLIQLRKILIPVTAKPSHWPAIEIVGRLCEELEIDDPEISCLHVGKDYPDLSHRSALKFEIKMAEGDVAGAICEEAESVDLVVMVTEGHTGILDAIMGSTTEQVIRQSPCPVLTVPS